MAQTEKCDDVSALNEILQKNSEQGIDLKEKYLDSIESEMIKIEEAAEEEELSGKKKRRRRAKNIRVRGIKKRDPPPVLKKGC